MERSSTATGSVELSIQITGAPTSVSPVPVVVAADGLDASGGESQTVPPAAAADAADDGESQPEKKLNCFVRILATGELVGNALGTLASLWATFVFLGGYRSSLNQVDFWIATAMVFLEAFRVFIRNFKLDSQSLFGSTKAFRRIGSSFARLLWRPQEGDAIVLIIGVGIKICKPLANLLGVVAGSYIQVAVLTLLSRIQLTQTITKQMRQRRQTLLAILIILLAIAAIVLFTVAMRAIALQKGEGIFVFPLVLRSQFNNNDILLDLWYPVPLLLDSLDILMQAVALVLLYLRPRRIATLISGPWGPSLLYLLKMISALLLVLSPVLVILPGFVSPFSTVVLVLGSLQDPAVPTRLFGQWIDGIMHICLLLYLVIPLPLPVNFSTEGDAILTSTLLGVLLIGNLQIPVTVAQIALSSLRLVSSHGDSPNMVASIKVFYALVLCQGSLYIMACSLALFSVVPRQSLARRSGFRGEWEARAVDLYYERAYTKRIEIGVFAEDTISLASFVVDAINSASSSRELHLSASRTRELQLVGVRVLHSLLQQGGSSNEELISVVTRSEKAVPTLISMLGWTFKQDRDIRLFAAKATADLSGYLRIARISGAVTLVSSLLDAENQLPSENDEGNGNNGSLGTHGDNEPPLTSPESLPVLGMMILEGLACDPDNCAEIVKNTNLITKIIGLISYTSNDGSSNDNALIISSSLNLVRMIATTNGKAGTTLRQELWESPFLLSNLTCVLEDSRSSPEVWKPAIDVISTLALDEGARHELGSVQVIIHKLLHIFITGQDGPTNYDQLLRVTAGAALANLAMESPENCLAMLGERQGCGYDLVKDLKGMLGSDEYGCVAASLLRNLCECSTMRDGDGLPVTFAECSKIKDRMSNPGVSNQLSASLQMTFAVCSRIKDWLSDPGVSNQLSSALLVVVQNIMAAEGKQLEVLIGLASQICYVLPSQPFVQGLESHITRATFVQKLVNTLNSNKQPNHEYPRMRRAIVDMVISVLRRYPDYAIIFRREGMVNALLKAEKTPSKVEKYRVFLGKEGVVLEHGLPLRDLVATAKDLIHQQLRHMMLKQAKMHD